MESVVVFVLYCIAVIVIGIVANKTTKGLSDYLAGTTTGIGPVVLSFTVMATTYSAGSYMSEVGLAYSWGYPAFWIACMSLLGMTTKYFWVGPRFNEIGKKMGYVTPGDFLAGRYYSTTVKVIQALLMTVFLVAYLVAQFQAMGTVFQVFLKIPYSTALILGVVLTVVYVSVGGYLAVVWTDSLQGLIMIVGAVLVPLACVLRWGGLPTLNRELLSLGEKYVSFSQGFPFPLWLFFLVGFGFATWGYPADLSRWFSLRKKSQFAVAAVSAFLLSFIIHFGTKLAGLYGLVHIRGVKNTDTLYALMAGQLLNPWLAGLILSALVGGAMSSVDSLLLMVTGAVSKDIWLTVRPGEDEARVKRWSQGLVWILAAISVALAFRRLALIVWISMFAWGGMVLTFAPPLLLGIFWKRATKEGAICGMLAGFVTGVIWYLLNHPLKIHGVVAGLAANLIAMILVSLLTPEPPKDVIASHFA